MHGEGNPTGQAKRSRCCPGSAVLGALGLEAGWSHTPWAALRSGGTSCKVQSTGLWGVHQIQVTSPSGRPPRVALRVQMAYSPGRLRAKCEWTEPVPGTLAPAEWAPGGLATLAVIIAPNDGALA